MLQVIKRIGFIIGKKSLLNKFSPLLQQATIGNPAATFTQGAPDSDVLKGRCVCCMLQWVLQGY